MGRRSTAKIKRGLGTERSRLKKIESDLCIERARLGSFRGFGTERARLGTFRGFGTERARLGTFNQNFEIFTQNEHLPAQRVFFLILEEISLLTIFLDSS